MKIDKAILKKSIENNIEYDGLVWLLNCYINDKYINIDNINHKYYLWLISIGVIKNPNKELLWECVKIDPCLSLKFASHYLDVDTLEYLKKLIPEMVMKYASHRLNTSQKRECNWLMNYNILFNRC